MVIIFIEKGIMKYPDDFIDKVICGDCLEVMKEIPDNSVDLVLTDPPYGVDIAEWDEVPSEEFLYECQRVGKTIIMFGGASVRSVEKFMLLKPERILIWSPSFTLSHLCTNDIAWRWHPIYCWDLPSKQNGIVWDVLNDNTECGNSWKHKCTKPLSLMSKLVAISNEHSIVLDPFLGSGTTVVACKQLNRHFIGIEINPDYCKIAKERLMGVPDSLFKE
jgi:site-specific DNA-methyltransferase (adenine-specific)